MVTMVPSPPPSPKAKALAAQQEHINVDHIFQFEYIVGSDGLGQTPRGRCRDREKGEFASQKFASWHSAGIYINEGTLLFHKFRVHCQYNTFEQFYPHPGSISPSASSKSFFYRLSSGILRQSWLEADPGLQAVLVAMEVPVLPESPSTSPVLKPGRNCCPPRTLEMASKTVCSLEIVASS